MRRRLELRDLRSLERRTMYSIFHPLDADERLPRELILESRRDRPRAMRRRFGLVGAFYLPGLMLTVVVLGSLHVSLSVAFAVAGVALAAVFAYVIWGRSD